MKFIAGGQSLGPMLNLRLAQPDLLVDLTGIAELMQVEETADSLSIGACVTHSDIEDGRVPDLEGGVLRSVARGIAYRAVRNRGTIGGSVAHADPSADWIACLAALGASVLVRGATGRRSVPIEEFMLGVFETALAPGELVQAISVPRVSPRAQWGYYKVSPQDRRICPRNRRCPVRPGARGLPGGHRRHREPAGRILRCGRVVRRRSGGRSVPLF